MTITEAVQLEAKLRLGRIFQVGPHDIFVRDCRKDYWFCRSPFQALASQRNKATECPFFSSNAKRRAEKLRDGAIRPAAIN